MTSSLPEKTCRVSETKVNPQARVAVELVPLEPAGADPEERYPVAVAQVKVGVYLEHETAEFFFFGANRAGLAEVHGAR